MMNLHELSVFLSVVDAGSFNGAGKRMHLSQPAISNTIRNLETSLGTDLFIRQGRRVVLSDAGHALIPMAQDLVSSAKRLKETMASLDGEVIGEFNIGCSTSSGKYILPRLIARFRMLFPHVRINVLIGDRKRVGSWLQEGKVSFAVSSRRLELKDLVHESFFDDPIELIVPSNHRWATFGCIYPDDLRDEPIIMREEGSGTRDVLIETLREHEITLDMLNISMVLGNAEAIEMAVAEGLGVAFISHLPAARGLELGQVRCVQVQGMHLLREIYVLRNHALPSTRAMSEFWDYITTQDMKEHLILPA